MMQQSRLSPRKRAERELQSGVPLKHNHDRKETEDIPYKKTRERISKKVMKTP